MSTTVEPYITHFYNAAKQFYVRGARGEYLGTTSGDLGGTETHSVIAQTSLGAPWVVVSNHVGLSAAQAGLPATLGRFHRSKVTRLEAWADTFVVPGAPERFILYAGYAADGVLLPDLRDRMVWLTEAIEIWFGGLRVEDGGPFADVLVEGNTANVQANWDDYQLSGTPLTDPGAQETEAMYDALISFDSAQLYALWVTGWHNRGTGGTWPDGDPIGGSP